MHLAAAVLALALLSAACRAPAKPAGDVPLVVGTTEAPGSADPAACYDFFCGYMLLPNTHETLTQFARGRTTPSPGLARSWEVSPDAKTYTFALRTEVRLHDGTPFTSDVMKSSLERVRRLNLPEGAAFLLFDTSNDPPERGIVSIEAPAPDRLVVGLARADATFPARLAFPAAAAISPAAYPADERAADTVAVGSGPYRLTAAAPGGALDLVRFEGYVGPPPATKRVRIRFFASSRDLRAAVERGDVDVALRSFAPEDVDALRRSDEVRLVVGTPSPVVRLLSFNVGREPFTKPSIRRAVAAAVDRSVLVQRVLRGAAVPLVGLVPRGVDGRIDAFPASPDPSVVAAALREAGVPEGERVAFELWYTPTHYGETEEAVAESLKRSLEDTGRFTVTLRSAEWADYKASLGRGDFGAFLLGWFPDVLDPDDFLSPFLGSVGARALGSGYANPEADRLLAEEQAGMTFAARRDALERLQRIAADDVPHVPLWQPLQIAAVRKGVSGLVVDETQVFRLSEIRGPR